MLFEGAKPSAPSFVISAFLFVTLAFLFVTPAKAGVQRRVIFSNRTWVPACAGMTDGFETCCQTSI